MEKTIIDIIDKKANYKYGRMTETKCKAYRAMLYAGAQVTQNGCSVPDIAAEIGYSEGATFKMVRKFIGLVESGDITVNLIISAINKLPKDKRFQYEPKPVKKSLSTFLPADFHIEEEIIEKPKDRSAKPNITKIHSFNITSEDKILMKAAIRESILYFQKYGKGTSPRMNGEYYSPGTNPYLEVNDSGKWLTLESAALYCGCNEEAIIAAGQKGAIERRVYRRNSNRNYYEYKVEDLDRFIRDNHLV